MNAFKAWGVLLSCGLLAGCTSVQPGVLSGNPDALKPFDAKKKAAVAELSACTACFCQPVALSKIQATYVLETLRPGELVLGAGTNTAHHLHVKCLQEIEKVLAASGLFKLVPMKELKAAAPRPEGEAEAVAKLIKDNKLRSAITASLNFTVRIGGKKLVVIWADWTVWGPDGVEAALLRTAVASDEGLEMFPKTTDPKYEAAFVELANRSAQDFVLLMKGETPKYSQRMDIRP
jgi:hypothetical protein